MRWVRHGVHMGTCRSGAQYVQGARRCEGGYNAGMGADISGVHWLEWWVTDLSDIVLDRKVIRPLFEVGE